MNYIYLILVTFFSIIFPNNINGVITDVNGQPINNVFIEYTDSLNQTHSIGYSNKDGNFNIENSDNKIVSISFSHIGYQEKHIQISSLFLDSNIILEIDNIESDLIVITGLRKQSYIKNTPVLTRVITSDDIQKSAYSSVKEVLEMSLPNVQNVMSSHAGISNEQVKIQGLDNKYLLFLIDGKRISGEFAGNLDFKMLDLSDIDRIEIVEGGMSSLYGSSAIGGVINIITKRNKDPFKIQYSYLYDNPMIKMHSLIVGLNYKHFFYNINFTDQATDGYDLTPSELQPGISIIKTLEEYHTQSIKHTFGYNNQKNINLELNHKNYNNDISMYSTSLAFFDGNELYEIYRNWLPRFEDTNYGFNFKFYKNKSLFKIIYNFEEYIKSNYYFNYLGEDCFQIDCNNTDNLTSAEFINAIDKRESILVQYNLDYKNNLLTLGCELNNDSYSSFNIYHYGYTDLDGNFDAGDYNDNGECDPFINDCLVESIFNAQDGVKKFNKKSFFIGNQWSFINDNRLGYSFRYVDSENFQDNYTYAFSYMIKNFQPYDIRFNYSKGFRTPAIKELYYNWYGHNPPIIGNPDLVPTTNNYISASIEKRYKNQELSFELFYNDVDDMIGINYSNDENGTQIAQYNNYKNILFYGINTHLSIKYDRNTFKCVYNFTNPESDNDEALELISKHSLRFNWIHNIIKNKLDFSFNTKYAGEKFIILGSEKLILDDYIISDAIAIVSFNKSIDLKFGCKNIFDYKDERRFLEQGSDFLTTYDPGRRFFLEFKYNFRN